MRRQHRIYLAGADGWNVGRHRDHAATPLARQKPAAGVHAAGMSGPRPLGHDPRTELFAKSRRMRIERDDRDAGQQSGAGYGVEHVRQHGLGEQAAFRAGPVFANIVLVDEVNRAMPKTQSALLEAMAEGQVTVEGQARRLPRPFFVIATENPIEQAGTFPLPEAQLDRFFLRTALGYPDPRHELEIIRAQRHHHPLSRVQQVVSAGDISVLQRAADAVYIDIALHRWIVDLVGATRAAGVCRVGASVRGSLALDRAVRGRALLEGRAFACANGASTGARMPVFTPAGGHRHHDPITAVAIV